MCHWAAGNKQDKLVVAFMITTWETGYLYDGLFWMCLNTKEMYIYWKLTWTFMKWNILSQCWEKYALRPVCVCVIVKRIRSPPLAEKVVACCCDINVTLNTGVDFYAPRLSAHEYNLVDLKIIICAQTSNVTAYTRACKDNLLGPLNWLGPHLLSFFNICT